MVSVHMSKAVFTSFCALSVVISCTDFFPTWNMGDSAELEDVRVAAGGPKWASISTFLQKDCVR